MSNVVRFRNKTDLAHSEIAHEFEGHHYRDAGVSFIVVDAPPASGPKLHKHPYEEVLWCRRAALPSRPETA